MIAPLRLGDLTRAGARGVSQYTGMVLALFLVQVIVSWGAGFIMMQILARAFADKPLFDDAVDGDLVALAEVVRDSSAVLGAIGWVAIGAVLTWIVLSWFLAGGVIAVFTERPRGRRETAQCFGAGGAGHFLVFARLGLLSLVFHIPVLLALGVGVGYASDRIEYALTTSDLLVPIVLGVLPAALLHVLVGTVVDYARAELVLRRPTHESLGALRAALRAATFVVRRPLAVAHVLVYWAAFAGVTAFFVWLSHGHAMLGTSGALALLAIREGLALLRFAMTIGVTAGQVELTATRTPPPRAIAPVVVESR